MEEAIRVCIRQRPLFRKEIERGHQKAWILKPDGTVQLNTQQLQVPPLRHVYSFDMSFDETSTNKDVYEKTARDIVLDAAKGINGCYMAYGQTGCGKTYSIMGTPQDPGILPRALSELFGMIEHGNLNKEDSNVYDTEYLMRVSYLEIYLERVNDLFQDGPKGETQPKENLDVKEDPEGGFRVVGLAEREVSCMKEVMQLIETAEMKRHFATTNFNETSSRSHTVFSVIVESTQTYEDGTLLTRRGELKLVDLAGNERATSGEGLEEAKERLAEGQAINKSLFLLSEVIAKLSKRAELQHKGQSTEKLKKELLHIPWRDSKLTRLLQKALGGNSRACLLVALHPSVQALEISLSTLRFAQKTKQIKKKVVENFVSVEQSLIMQQKETINRLQQQLLELRHLTDADTLSLLDHHRIKGGNDPSNVLGNLQHTRQSNESIKELKNILEAKIKKLSRLILHTNLDKGRDPPRIVPQFRRSATITGFQRRMRKLETLSSNYQHQLYYSPRSSNEIGENQNDMKPILGALDYLENFVHQVMDLDDLPEFLILVTAVVVMLLKKEPDSMQKTQNSYLQMSDQEDLSDTNEKKTSVKTPRVAIPATPRHPYTSNIDKEQLHSKTLYYKSQVDFFKNLFLRLGLSPLLTCAKTLPEQNRKTLTYSFTVPFTCFDRHKISSTEQLVQSIRNVQPLAYAMLMKLFCHVTSRYIGEEKSFEIQNVGKFFGMTSPWEQYILALGYQQQDIQEQLKKMLDKFKKKIHQLRTKLHGLVIEKHELLDHTARLVEEIRQFRYKTTSGEQASIKENFAKLLDRFNNLSYELATRSAECQQHKFEYQLVVKERDKLQEQLDQVPQSFINFDASALPHDLELLKKDEKYTKILSELINNRFLAAESRFHLEECSHVLKDLQKVNHQLCCELISLSSSLHNTNNDNKLIRFQLKSERLEFQKKLEQTHILSLTWEKEKKILQNKLKEMSEERNELLKQVQENSLRAPSRQYTNKGLYLPKSASSFSLTRKPSNQRTQSIHNVTSQGSLSREKKSKSKSPTTTLPNTLSKLLPRLSPTSHIATSKVNKPNRFSRFSVAKATSLQKKFMH